MARQEVARLSPYEKALVRTVIKDGEPWFIANHVCKALKLSHLRGALSTCDNDEKAVISAETSKGV